MTAAPHLNYSAQRVAARRRRRRRAGTPARRPRSATGGCRAPATDADAGPGLLPAARRARPRDRRRRRDAAQRRRAASTSRSSIVHPGGVSELYLGQVKGPRIDLATDAVVRTAGAKDVRRGDPPVRPRRRPPALGVGHRRARPGPRDARLGTPGAGRLMTGSCFALGVPGAVDRRRRRCRHFGNPLGEQRALGAGAAIATSPTARVLAVTGPDRLSLARLAHVAGARPRSRPGESTELLMLDPHGHIEHAASVVDDGETTWLIVDAGGCRGAAAWLAPMRFMLRVESPTRATSTPSSAARRAALDALAAAAPAGVPLVWARPVAARRRPAATRYAPRRAAPRRRAATGPRRSCRAPRSERIADAARRGRGRARRTPSPPRRCASRPGARGWRPRSTSGRSRTSSTGCAPRCTSSKGCYRGQETVAKVHNLGHPPRRLVLLHLDGSDTVLPVAGRRRCCAGERRRRRRSRPRRAALRARARSRSRSCARTTPVDAALVGRHRRRSRSPPRRRSSCRPRPARRRTCRACRGSRGAQPAR